MPHQEHAELPVQGTATAVVTSAVGHSPRLPSYASVAMQPRTWLAIFLHLEPGCPEVTQDQR